jgi:hypothetical protein
VQQQKKKDEKASKFSSSIFRGQTMILGCHGMTATDYLNCLTPDLANGRKNARKTGWEVVPYIMRKAGQKLSGHHVCVMLHVSNFRQKATKICRKSCGKWG